MEKFTETDHLILEYLQGSLDDTGEKELRAWINSHPENRKQFTQTCAMWELSSLGHTEAKFDKQKNWDILSHRIHPKNKVQKLITRWANIAAIFVVAFGTSYFTIRFFERENKTQAVAAAWIINEAPMGNMSKVTLPDGSEIWLNAGSKIKYATNFNVDDRYINLKGEAYFHVSTNKEKPFTVNASGIEVKATGTRFNVKAYDEEEIIETTLEEGIISVINTTNEKRQEVILKPNEKITVYKKSARTLNQDQKVLQPNINDDFKNTPIAILKIELASNVETPVYTSWKDNEWIIQNEKLESLAIKLGRRYDVSIQLIDDHVKNYSYTGTLKDETLEQVLEVISQTSPIKYKLEKKQVSLWYNKEYN